MEALGADFVASLVPSFMAILVSEIADKTFFIAAIMAMRNPRAKVFGGSLSALALMTVLSAALGWAAPNLIPKTWTHYASVVLFFFFGASSLKESLKSGDAEESELEQVENEFSSDKLRSETVGDSGAKDPGQLVQMLRLVFSPVFIKAFTLCFLAEWGDRSQIVTIGLAAARNVYGVTLGGVLGHAVCTGAAVLGGKQLASHINEQMVAAIGGVVFLIFGAVTLYEGPSAA